MESLPWSEVKTFARDAAVILEASEEERQAFSQLKQLKGEIQALTLGRENDAKKLIQGLTRTDSTIAATNHRIYAIYKVLSLFEGLDIIFTKRSHTNYLLQSCKFVCNELTQKLLRTFLRLKNCGRVSLHWMQRSSICSMTSPSSKDKKMSQLQLCSR
jgi:hypothetical protein